MPSEERRDPEHARKVVSDAGAREPLRALVVGDVEAGLPVEGKALERLRAVPPLMKSG